MRPLQISFAPAAGYRWPAMGLSLVIACCPKWASASETPEILVESEADALSAGRIGSSDTASLLSGVDSAQAGGVSGLPMIHGLGDDRVRILVNGVPVTAACPMHMNPPLSYVDPSNVAHIEILPGVTPVRLGGDSIAGTIQVESAPPDFAATDDSIERAGQLSTYYRSNSSAYGGSAAASMASRDLSLSYQGSATRAGDYRDGAGERINASRFETLNSQFTAAYRRGQHLFEAQASLQHIPFQGFPNADMDMQGNIGAFFNARYTGGYEWGDLHVNTYYDHISHEMNGNAPDRYPPSLSITAFGEFPTRERGQDFGYRAEADIVTSTRDTLRLGNEFHTQTLDDRWPGPPAGMMFDYISLNGARRAQLGTFAEWERQWNERWTTQFGVRNDTVRMDTGPVQGYDGIDPEAASFNAMPRARTDVNIDSTLLVRYQPDELENYTLGLARKNRSPNLYERYAWGTNTMGTVTWFGDGNGYTGNPDLKPETAYTVSLSGNWHDRDAKAWQMRATSYFTSVQNYIGVLPLCDPACSGMPASQLLFANQRARLYGADANAAYTLSDNPVSGVFRITGSAGYAHGEDSSTQTPLYHVMPFHGILALEHDFQGWSSALQFHTVDRKSEIDPMRLEPPTPGYSLVDLRIAYVWRNLRLDFAATNLFDRQYASPLGGTWQSALYPPGYAGATFRPLPAAGRSLDTGFTVNF
ncbi:MAG TPA: TonB-dependent receptor [Steroidobacteraceae bacterium]|nr:TonB-dependent receptor [Steroidobacteraceae bacterium]